MKRLALAFGIAFVLLGLAGFVPVLCPHGRVFGLFATNQPHDIFYLASGALGALMSLGTRSFARKYFRLIGIVYALIAAMGFLEGRADMVLGMAMNWPDNVLDLVIGVVTLAIGFSPDPAVADPRAST